MSSSLHLGLVGPLPPPAGGMATQTRQLAELLRHEGVRVSVVQSNKPYKPAMVARLKGIRALCRLIPYFFSVWRLAGTVDVIHLMANSGWSWQLFAAPVVWVGWLRKTPVIVNYRGGYAREYLDRSFSNVAPTLKRASEVVVPSGFLERVFSDFDIKTRIIPNIVNLDRFKPKANLKASDTINLIITRNLERIYGIDTALKAVARVKEHLEKEHLEKQTMPKLHLKIAGTGHHRQALENMVVALGIQDTVTFVGRLNSEEIVPFYQSANMMINPTTVDNMPNSVLEALACGIPVVTTDVGGIPYIVEHNKTALLVPVNDPEAMAQQIIRLITDSSLAETLTTNGLVAVMPYHWPEVKNKWIDLYQSLAVLQ